MSSLKEVADLAGVSEATASRALRDVSHVKRETRNAVRAAAKELLYGPYALDPDFDNTPTTINAVGVIAPFLNRWYFSHAIAGAEQILRDAGLNILLYNFDQIRDRGKLFKAELKQSRVIALLIVSVPPTEEEFQAVLNVDIPLSLIGVTRDGHSSVTIDDEAGGKTATQHLINQGHRKIGLITGPRTNLYNFAVSNDRRNGYLAALKENGLEFNPEHEVIGDFTLATGLHAMNTLLARKDRPTAVFCESDEMAIGAIHSIRKHGLRVPEDISVVGFDDYEMSEFADLTTIRQSVSQLGELAAYQILEKLKKPSTVPRQITLPTKLIVRGSTHKI
jgi:DNA-binding LacI/PurR family transcriptional regulator